MLGLSPNGVTAGSPVTLVYAKARGRRQVDAGALSQTETTAASATKLPNGRLWKTVPLVYTTAKGCRGAIDDWVT